jgi:hypothetical protein
VLFPRRTIGVLWLAAALTASEVACGGGSTYTGLVSCTQLENVENFGLLQTCEEVEASARSQLQQGCAAAVATDGGSPPTVVDAPCSRAETLGGCEITSGGIKESFWYSPSGADAEAGATPSDIQRLCAGSSGTYLAP